MSRLFAGQNGNDQQIILSPGGITTDGGPITVLSFWRPGAAWDGVLVNGIASSATTWGYISAPDNRYYVRGDFTGLASGVVVGSWQIIGYTKASGNAAVRWHKRVVAGSWSHTNGVTIGDQGVGTSIRIGNGLGDFAGLRLRGEWVCSAVWNTALNDAAVEAAGSLTALQAWFDANPAALWAGNQANTSTAVVDLMGGGANEISAPSTANPPAVSANEPPSWSYTISSGVTGTVAFTEVGDVVAASGTFTPPGATGDITFTETDDAVAASGTFTPELIDGAVAFTEADDTVVAAGAFTAPGATGTITFTEQGDVVAAAGTATPPINDGVIAFTEADDVVLGVTTRVDISVTISSTRAASVSVSTTRSRVPVDVVGDTRTGWSVGATRTGWVVGSTRTDRGD